MFADYIVELDMLDSANRSESFAESLLETLNENLPEDVELTNNEWHKLQASLQDFIEEELDEEAIGMVEGWNEDAQEYEEAKRSAIYG